MPNIEICGYSTEEAATIQSRIESIMQEMGLGEDAVTSIIPMTVTSCDGKRSPKPFLRICSTDMNEINRILLKIAKGDLRADIETLVLTGFVSIADFANIEKLLETALRQS